MPCRHGEAALHPASCRYRTFVHEIDRSGVTNTSWPIVRTIIELGRSLGLRLIAEGVETERQAEFLRSLGCGVMQGHTRGPRRGLRTTVATSPFGESVEQGVA